MDVDQVRRLMLERYGIRVEPEMAAYVHRRLTEAGTALRGAECPVMGGDARTGIAVRQIISMQRLNAGEPNAM